MIKLIYNPQVSDEVKSSVFRDALDHWREMNITAEFSAIVKQMNQFVTLPQVFHHLTHPLPSLFILYSCKLYSIPH